MPILDDFVCDKCQAVREGWRDEPPLCCGTAMHKAFTRVNHWEWGGPRTIRTMRDEPFSSRSEMKAWAKAHDLQEVGDKVGGARNEDHRNLNKLYSYPGAPTRSKVEMRGEN